MSVSFKSLEELYSRLTPALTVRKEELSKEGYSYIKEEDIFEALRRGKWNTSVNLTLFDLVNDILNINIEVVDAYLKQKY